MMETEGLMMSLPRTMHQSEQIGRLARPFLPLDQDRLRTVGENGFLDPITSMDNSPPQTDKHKNSFDFTENKSGLLTVDETADLFKKKIADAQQDTEHALAGSEGVTNVVKPKLTLDLGHSNIARLPEPVVDLIKEEVERLSLSHNQIWHIPLRFAECTHLRYLNIRSNVFREIPRGVYKLSQLEILDVSRNKVRKISKEIRNLTALRVFSLVHNRIDDLPPELCEMSKLQIIKIAENPLRFKLKKVIEAKETEVAFLEMTDNERETAITSEVKRYLREIHPLMTPLVDQDVSPEMNESPMDTPKPSKRNVSSRFPVIPSTAGVDGNSEKSSPPNQANAPPIPTRSHYRMVSGQGLGIKRPGIAPLISSNERNRSNSESVLQASAAARTKRMGMLKNKQELDSIDENRTNRNSHLRGYSHGSILKKNGALPSPSISQGSGSPNSPRDGKRRVQVLRRLSSLPEYKLEKEEPNTMIEGAKSVIFALFQLHPQIGNMISAIRIGKETDRRSSLECTLYNASTHIDRLNKSLEHVSTLRPDDEEALERAEDVIQRDCATCIMAYTHVAHQLQQNIRKVVLHADVRYVRTMMLMMFGSIMELRNAMSNWGMEVQAVEGNGHRRKMSSGHTHPIQTIPEEIMTPQKQIRSVTPTRDRVIPTRPGARLRSDTAIQHPVLERHQNLPLLPTAYPTSGNPLNPSYNSNTVATSNMQSASQFAIRSRSNSRNPGNMSATSSTFSSHAGTPRSTEFFQLPPPNVYGERINPNTGMTTTQEDGLFEQIFVALTKSYDTALTAIPLCRQQFQRCLEMAEETRQPKVVFDLWSTLIYRCKSILDVSEALQLRLSNMKVREVEPTYMKHYTHGRNDPSFWMIAKRFLHSFVELVTDMREAKNLRVLPPELIHLLRPIQGSSREAGKLIEKSPWRHLAEMTGPVPPPSTYPNNHNLTNGHGGYTNGIGPTPSMYNYLHHHHHHQSQSPFPPPMIPVPPLPNSASSSSLSGMLMMNNPGLAPSFASNNSATGAGASPASVPLPATPLSAALGPAAQATVPTSAVPSTPMSAYGDSFFRGDVFQRADSLLNMQQSQGAVNFLGPRK